MFIEKLKEKIKEENDFDIISEKYFEWKINNWKYWNETNSLAKSEKYSPYFRVNDTVW